MCMMSDDREWTVVIRCDGVWCHGFQTIWTCFMGTIPSELVEHIPFTWTISNISWSFIRQIALGCNLRLFPIKRHLLLHGSQVPIVAHCELMKQVARVVREPRWQRKVGRNLDPRKIDVWYRSSSPSLESSHSSDFYPSPCDMLMFSPVQVNSLQLPKCWNQPEERQNQVSSQHSHLGLMSKRLAHGWWNSEEESDIILYYYKKCDAVPLFTYRQNIYIAMFHRALWKIVVSMLDFLQPTRGQGVAPFPCMQWVNSQTLPLWHWLLPCIHSLLTTALGTEEVQQARGLGPGVSRESVGEVESKNSTAGHGPSGKIKGLVNPGPLVLHSGVSAFIHFYSTY